MRCCLASSAVPAPKPSTAILQYAMRPCALPACVSALSNLSCIYLLECVARCAPTRLRCRWACCCQLLLGFPPAAQYSASSSSFTATNHFTPRALVLSALRGVSGTFPAALALRLCYG